MDDDVMKKNAHMVATALDIPKVSVIIKITALTKKDWEFLIIITATQNYMFFMWIVSYCYLILSMLQYIHKF